MESKRLYDSWLIVQCFLCNAKHLPALQPYFDELDHFVVNLVNFLGLAFTVSEPVFVPVVDST
jgi:hypothetical protein